MQIEMNNAAFDDDEGMLFLPELNRILLELSETFVPGPPWEGKMRSWGPVSIRDVNGNTVGQWKIINERTIN